MACPSFASRCLIAVERQLNFVCSAFTQPPCLVHATLCPFLCKRATTASVWKQVAQLYISRPLLWKGRKFDLRIVALLVSSQPLELYVHNCYWPRVAERPHETKREESLEDPRVSLTATHLVGETAVGEACHPHYEVSHLP